MKSYIYGKKIKRTYNVKYERDENEKIKSKPILDCTEEVEYSPILKNSMDELVVDGEIGRNGEGFLFFDPRVRINISENTEVIVLKKIYRADLNAYIVHTDYVITEDDTNKYDMEMLLLTLVAEYNKSKIEDDEKARAYCKLHKLNPAETDYDELVKLLRPEETSSRKDYFSDLSYGIWSFKNSLMGE